MRKLKFIGFVVALMVMVTSMTSCLSNSNDSGQQSGTALLVYETFGKFKDLTGGTVNVTNSASGNFQIGQLYFVYYVTQTADNSTTGTTTPTISIQQANDGSLMAFKIGDDYPNNTAIDKETFKADTLTSLADTLKTEAAVASITTNGQTDGFYVWNYNGRYTILTGLDYFFEIPNQNSKTLLQDVININKFYLYYDEDKLTDENGTLHLYLKHYTTKTETKDNEVLVNYGVGYRSPRHPQLYYKTFSLDNAMAAYQSKNGSAPTKITITASVNTSNWKLAGSTTKDYTFDLSKSN